jgi:hypothetical protein
MASSAQVSATTPHCLIDGLRIDGVARHRVEHAPL